MTFSDSSIVTEILILLAFFAGQCVALGDDASKSPATTEYSWQLDEVRRKDVFEAIKTLAYGEAITDAEKALGSPTRDMIVTDKNKEATFKFHALIYAIRRVTPDGGNVKDQEIHLLFDKLGHLYEIDYSAMNPLAGKVIGSDEPVPGVKNFHTTP